VIADLKAHLLSHPRLSQAALRASAQVGDPASEVRFIVEGHARMEATFINLPDTHRAIEFPIMLLTNGLEWCGACSVRWAGPAGEGVERMQVATAPWYKPSVARFQAPAQGADIPAQAEVLQATWPLPSNFFYGASCWTS